MSKATMTGNSVDLFIANLENWQKELAKTIQQIVRDAAPDAVESILWSQPVWTDHGPFCYLKVCKEHLNFGFWRGAELPDPDNLLRGSGQKMRHVRLTEPKDIKPDSLGDLVKIAVELNRLKGSPR